MERGTIRVVVYEAEQGEHAWPPAGLSDFTAWLQSQVESIPAEHRGTATIELGKTILDEDFVCGVVIAYTRPETDEEVKAKEDRAQRLVEQQRLHELRQLSELQAKHGR
jgi:hypothetical protein